MSEIRAILHPTDLSEASEAACQLARALAREYGARMVVLHAFPPSLTGAEAVDRRRPDGIEDDLLARMQELIPDDQTVSLDYQVMEGPPADAILAAAAREGCDLIVMGTHGRTGLSRALLGSVAEVVSRRARCPVATVRPSVPVPREAAGQEPGEKSAVTP
jgi:nucleotide-binding universal stress UspA family protein